MADVTLVDTSLALLAAGGAASEPTLKDLPKVQLLPSLQPAPPSRQLSDQEAQRVDHKRLRELNAQLDVFPNDQGLRDERTAVQLRLRQRILDLQARSSPPPATAVPDKLAVHSPRVDKLLVDGPDMTRMDDPPTAP